MDQKFLICSHCGNIIAMVRDKGVPVVCCGEKMKEIIPGTADAAQEKHVPVWKQEGGIVSVVVGSVEHPMLPEHPDHALYERYFPNGGGSIFTFDIRGGQEEAHRFIDHLKLFSLLANVADLKSLVIHPATTTHSQSTREELEEQGIRPNTIRLSIGTEHIEDILQDLREAFDAVSI